MEATSVLATELQALLSPLKGGSALDTGKVNSTDETVALFEKHIGPYEDVLENAARHVENLWDDELYCHQTRSSPVNRDRFVFPKFGRLEGPRPDPCVWMGLFFGRKSEERTRQEIKKADDSSEIDAYLTLRNNIVDKTLVLPVLELMRNILRYLREESSLLPDAMYVLRFCALYGLSGVMDDVLDGGYGPVGTVTIDSPLPFKEHDPSKNDFFISSYWNYEDMFIPAWAFGAALGHCNVVRHAIHDLGAKTDMNLIMKMKVTGEMQEPECLAGLMLFWAIKSNQPKVVKCLVVDCGFQFRWISDQFRELFELLFHIDGMRDEFSVWRSKEYDPEEHVGDYSQRKYRARCCYNEKQTMLRTMIDVGLPFELFVPQINVEVEKKMSEFMDDNKGASRSKLHKFLDSLTPVESKARGHLYAATTEFNAVQHKRDTVTLTDFHEKIVDMWKNQSSAQERRSAEFEKLDPRWEKYEANGESAFDAWWARKRRDDY